MLQRLSLLVIITSYLLLSRCISSLFVLNAERFCVMNFSTFIVFYSFIEYRGSWKWNGGKLVSQAFRSTSSGNFSIAKPGLPNLKLQSSYGIFSVLVELTQVLNVVPYVSRHYGAIKCFDIWWQIALWFLWYSWFQT